VYESEDLAESSVSYTIYVHIVHEIFTAQYSYDTLSFFHVSLPYGMCSSGTPPSWSTPRGTSPNSSASGGGYGKLGCWHT